MKRLHSLIATVGLVALISCTNESMESVADDSPFIGIKTPEEFMNPEGNPKPAVTMIGTFHFDYPGLDAHKTAESDKIDVLDDQRQKEIGQVLDHLARFNPNKVVIESKNPTIWNDRYRQYLNGDLEPMRDERVQLGFAIAKRFNLDTLYCLDAGSFSGQYGEFLAPLLDTLMEGYDWQSDDPLEEKINGYYDYFDSQLKNTSLYDHLRAMNTEEIWNMNFGAYLIGDFRLDNFAGADALAIYWYNRNLRIFRKIQMITESPEDRILVIFGNGHVAILNQLYNASPEYNYTPFGEL